MLEELQARVLQFRDTAPLSVWDLMALGQHHGLPTRLLDWSENPLVAACFAVTSPPGRRTYAGRRTGNDIAAQPLPERIPASIVAYKVEANDVVDMARHAGDKIEDVGDVFGDLPVRFFEPRSVTERIVTQGGLFSIHARPYLPWSEPLSDDARTFRIPGWARACFKSRLFQLGVDAQRILGGLDGLCAGISWKHTDRFEIEDVP